MNHDSTSWLAVACRMAAPLPRRDLLAGSVFLSLIGLAGCKRDTCPSEPLSAEELKLRETLKYSDHAADPRKVCSGCQQFLPKPDADCGRCKLFKGPIHPAGSCLAFASKV